MREWSAREVWRVSSSLHPRQIRVRIVRVERTSRRERSTALPDALAIDWSDLAGAGHQHPRADQHPELLDLGRRRDHHPGGARDRPGHQRPARVALLCLSTVFDYAARREQFVAQLAAAGADAAFLPVSSDLEYLT